MKRILEFSKPAGLLCPAGLGSRRMSKLHAVEMIRKGMTHVIYTIRLLLQMLIWHHCRNLGAQENKAVCVGHQSEVHKVRRWLKNALCGLLLNTINPITATEATRQRGQHSQSKI
eukprot:gnl/TRDRNA2_/TRDRNA2_180787_c0_seq1.p1 gnl/TRDRNA2_/TRDRNA2_180787_c0~~gnl/TRDRNA2_/TRDRNA2_180787_c0_seq1.p1  ORF type:complete len:115 (+),score=5.17 gnl/TRDRNA2_/TRDRNA2_180787_c0_seq1:183-527(+)